MPAGPWMQVAIDFKGPLPSGEYLMVIMDEYSSFPEVEIINSLTATTVIPRIDKVFATLGCPQIVITDNGPPFQGADFSKFAAYLGFKHRKITPLWPRANGTCERFMDSIGKMLRTTTTSRQNWRQELYRFLRSYRATPHPATGKSPASLLHCGREYNIQLPTLVLTPPHDAPVRQRDLIAKEKARKYVNNRHSKQPHQLNVGDVVLHRSKQRRNKMSPLYSDVPHVVISRKGSMITGRSGNHTITRNTSFFKKIKKQHFDDDMDEAMQPPNNNLVPPLMQARPRRNTRVPHRYTDTDYIDYNMYK